MFVRKAIIGILSIIGILTVSYGGFTVYQKVQSGDIKILGESTSKLPSAVVNKSVQQTADPAFSGDAIAIPTLQQSIHIPTMSLVNCWKLKEDGKTYEYNFGQILQDDCKRKVAMWKEASEKEFKDTIDKQTTTNEKAFLNMPTLPPSQGNSNQFSIQ